MEATAITDFSSVQTTLLSSDAPDTRQRAARLKSAVSSTTAGGLPGPAQTARLPDFIAASTTAPPPVTSTMPMLGCFISAWADSTVGSARQQSSSAGKPALLS